MKPFLKLLALAVAVAGGLFAWSSRFDGMEAALPGRSSVSGESIAPDSPGITDSPGVTEMPVEVDTLRHVTQASRQLVFTGTLRAARRSGLGFERSGRLEQVFVDEGESLRKGEPIANLDQRQLQIQIRETQARLAQQQAVLDELTAGPRKETIEAAAAELDALKAEAELRQLTLTRTQELSKRDAAARQNVDDALFGWKMMAAKRDSAARRLEELTAGTRAEQIAGQQASVQILESQLERLRLEEKDSTLLAPFDGIVVQRLADEGTMLTAQQSVIELLETGRMEAHIGIPTAVVPVVRASEYLVLSVDGRDLTGNLRQVLPQVDPTTRTQSAIIDLRGENAFLADGQIVKLRLSESMDTDGYRVPVSALSSGSKGLWSLAVVETTEEGREIVRLRPVEVVLTEGETVVVRGAVDGGERFVRQGAHRLTDGQRIHQIRTLESSDESAQAAEMDLP
ncbi:MAG: efflux RND transporter periplasmic adaptor subunit [Planctomycetaceae bacterium]